MEFSENLKKIRKSSGYTAKELAKVLELPYTTYIAYENQGREPKFDTLMRIAYILHVSIDELLGYTPDAPDELGRAINLCQSLGFTVNVSKNQDRNVSITSSIRDYFPISEKAFVESVHKALEDPDYLAMKKMSLRTTLGKYFLDAWRKTWNIENGGSYLLTKEQQAKIKPILKAYVQELKKHPNSEAYIEYFGAPGEVYEKFLAEHPDSEECKEYYGDNGDDNEDNKNNNE